MTLPDFWEINLHSQIVLGYHPGRVLTLSKCPKIELLRNPKNRSSQVLAGGLGVVSGAGVLQQLAGGTRT
jgi:hypothetical protein